MQDQDPVQTQDPAQAKVMAPAMAQVLGLAKKVDTRAMGLVMAQVSDLVKVPVRDRT